MKEKSYRDIVTEEQRLVILRLLDEDIQGQANSSLLEKGLDALGLTASRDLVHTQLAWLAEQGLIEVESLRTVMIARLTSRGRAVAQRKAAVPGVARSTSGG
jgi:hypothetical protein